MKTKAKDSGFTNGKIEFKVFCCAPINSNECGHLAERRREGLIGGNKYNNTRVVNQAPMTSNLLDPSKKRGLGINLSFT